jgi:hypothetical protein
MELFRQLSLDFGLPHPWLIDRRGQKVGWKIGPGLFYSRANSVILASKFTSK